MDILKPKRWQHVKIICYGVEVKRSYDGGAAYILKACGLNAKCPLYNLCKRKKALEQEK